MPSVELDARSVVSTSCSSAMPNFTSAAPSECFGVEPGASMRCVTQAYRTLAQRWHPDTPMGDPEDVRQAAAEIFRRIQNGYDTG